MAAAEQVERVEEEVLVPVLPITHNWAGRQFHFSDVTLNGTTSNAAIVVPGQPIDISLKYRTSWDRGPDDYCPGCVVQLYYGMGEGAKKGKGGFSTGIVRSGISNMRNSDHSQTTFSAPTEPGVYYITWAISLDYNFVNKDHDNESKNGIAVIRVLHKSEWSAAMLAPFVNSQTRSLIAAFLLYCSRDSEAEVGMQNLSSDVAQKIAAYLMISSFEDMLQ